MSNVKVTVGHSVAFSIIYLDQNGNPMLTTPTPDSPPVWSDTTPATETLTPAASGLTASAVALAAGTDVVTVAVTVGGANFTGTCDVEVDAVPQVLTSVDIAAVAS